MLRICVSASLQFGRFIAEAIDVACYGFGGAFAFDTCFIAFRITLLDPPERFLERAGTETRLAFNHLFIWRVERERFSPNVEIGEEEFVTKSLEITRVTR